MLISRSIRKVHDTTPVFTNGLGPCRPAAYEYCSTMDPGRRWRNLQVVESQLLHLRDRHLLRPTVASGLPHRSRSGVLRAYYATEAPPPCLCLPQGGFFGVYLRHAW
jgi:hypothetical protein